MKLHSSLRSLGELVLGESTMKKIACLALSMLLTAAVGLPSWAGAVLERIEKTGTITAGPGRMPSPLATSTKKGNGWGFPWKFWN